jgi:glycosyltransferase involved in cell wall biosynthesis
MISVCLPTYKGSHLLPDSLPTILSQSYGNFEIIIGDDNGENVEEAEKTLNVINAFNSDKIRYIRNDKNLGYPLNLQSLVKKSSGDIIFLFAQDDLLAKDVFERVFQVFINHPEVGVITRPYFWFAKDWRKPIRALTPFSIEKDTILDLHSCGWEGFYKIFESVGQLSGLAYRKSCIDLPFHNDIFPAHIYPFASILTKNKCMYLRDYTVAVGTEDSQTRLMSSIYQESPTLTWINMYKNVFDKPEFIKYKKYGIRHASTNYLGLLQIKCHSNFIFFIVISFPSIFNFKISLVFTLISILPK